ncbi:Gfo/Idh/MocA family oxidoreductase [Deinococcus planocerae]|uniref:Gfo/Idh/MocA family oxidoreductase n=1 Tax=Deinococcus planocerae TaxID=1737569 RepID=UPI000C7F31F1|nr:Gfo/Idh/MocA family oxidoreductase [Deinococcus planocerae]
MHKTIAVGVIGTGGMGTRHAHNLHRLVPGAAVAGTSDVDRDRAARVAAECGGAAVFDDPYQLIEDPTVNAVLIASTDSTHAAFVRACLEAGKPVMCEKPLAETAQDAWHLVQAEQALGRRLVAVGLMRRFDPQHLAVERAVRAGKVGRGLMFKGTHRNAKVPTHLPGRVVITNSAVHDIDSARWLLGQEVTEVFVRGVRTRPHFSGETVDMLLLQLALTDGCLATVEVTSAAGYGYEVCAEVVGETGTVTTAQPADAVVRLNGQSATDVDQIWLDRFRQAYVDELVGWVESVQTGTSFRGASAWDGYVSQVVTDACIEALNTGQPVQVPTPETPALYREDAAPEVVGAD